MLLKKEAGGGGVVCLLGGGGSECVCEREREGRVGGGGSAVNTQTVFVQCINYQYSQQGKYVAADVRLPDQRRPPELWY